MDLKIGRDVFWLCTKSSDLLFRSIENAGNYVAETMMEMKEKGEYEEGFFEGLAKVERTRDDKFTVTDVSEEMWRQATITTWKETNDKLTELDAAKMEVVKRYGEYRDGKK